MCHAVLSGIPSRCSGAVWLSESPISIQRDLEPKEVFGINVTRGSNPASYINGWVIEGKKKIVGRLVGYDGEMDRGFEFLTE